MQDYKIIEIRHDSRLNDSEISLVSQLINKYPKGDIYFEIDYNRLNIYLRQLNLRKFKKDADVLSTLYGNAGLLHSIVESIEKIRSYGLKGKKRVYVGYKDERKVKGRLQKVLKREKYFYAKDNNFSDKNNSIPEKFVNQILCSDSEIILKELPDNCIDLILTSPPYNFGLDYHETDDDFKWQKYFDKLFLILGQCIRVLKYDGRIIINIQPLYSDYIPSHHIISNFFMKNKLMWKGEIIWEKHNYNCKYTAWGSWKSPSNPYIKGSWEFLEIFCKGSMKKEGNKMDIDLTDEEFKKWVYAKWDIAPERNMKKYGHPAMFPEELVKRTLKLFSYRNDLVLDPFNGAGTTSAVAKKLGRRYIGIDISEEYCKTAKQRIELTLF